MRSNEYYSKPRVAIVIAFAIVFYIVLTVMAGITAKDASNLDMLDFTPNFDKKFKEVVVLSSTKVNNSDTKDDYSLRNVSYDMSTLYLDWSEIEAERSRLEQEAKEKAARELERIQQERDRINSLNKVVSTLRSVEGSLDLPDIYDTSFKGYMCVSKVTSKSSNQWEFLHSGNFDLYTDSNGIMMYNGYYVVAMASYYTDYKVGSTFRITLDSGISFDVITGDEKADKDTDSNRTYRPKGHNRGEIVEYIIYCGENNNEGVIDYSNYTTMSEDNRRLGDLSSLGFQGNVVMIEKLDDYSVVNRLYKQ